MSRPRIDLVIDTCHDTDLEIEDRTVEIVRHSGVVRCGIGTEAWVHPGNVVDVTEGAIVHLAPGAHLEEDRQVQLIRAEVSVCVWESWPRIELEQEDPQ